MMKMMNKDFKGSKMILETLELLSKYDIVLTDRTPFDCVAYEMAVNPGIFDTELTENAQSLYDISMTLMKISNFPPSSKMQKMTNFWVWA
jgi:hypothetical protein